MGEDRNGLIMSQLVAGSISGELPNLIRIPKLACGRLFGRSLPRHPAPARSTPATVNVEMQDARPEGRSPSWQLDSSPGTSLAARLPGIALPIWTSMSLFSRRLAGLPRTWPGRST